MAAKRAIHTATKSCKYNEDVTMKAAVLKKEEKAGKYTGHTMVSFTV